MTGLPVSDARPTRSERAGRPGFARLGRLARDRAPLLVLAALVAGTALLSHRFLLPTNLVNVLLQASVMAVLAMGMTYVVIAGGFDLSVGSTVALAGCVAALVMLSLGVLAGVAAGVATGLAIGALNGWLIAGVGLNPFIATLGTMVVVRGAALLMTDGQPISGDNGLPALFIAYGRASWLRLPLLTWTPIAIFAALWWMLHQTAHGKRLFATGGNAEAAFLAGIPVRRVRASAYAMSGLMAGIAGVMLAARLQSGQPTAAEGYELTAIAAVVLGGASLQGGEGRLSMTLAGVFIITILANALNLLNVDSYWQRIAVGLVILAAAAADQLRRRRRF
jgi:ribose transport system permease protein